ncbi:MAG: response regulator, partial [Planctomycetota bacterium]
GLGLSTAAALLREQDGSIELVKPVSGQGATTVITLPAAEPAVRRPSNYDIGNLIGTPTQSPATILVVDDEPMVAEILVDVLKDAGRQTATAGTLADAMTELTRIDICALVVDLHLPDGSGLDFARRALALKPQLAGHIALTTGESDHEIIERLIAEHGFPVLAKPFRIDEVLSLAKQIA